MQREKKAHFNRENFVVTPFLQKCTSVTYIWRPEVTITVTVCYRFSATVRFESEMFGFRGNIIKCRQFIDELQW